MIPPTRVQQELPQYPESALSDSVACVAKILYHVETSGHAKLVRLEWVEPPPPGHVGSFEEAIGLAMSRWRFEPAIRIVPEKQEDGSIEPKTTPVPTTQHALVRFAVVDGKPVVD